MLLKYTIILVILPYALGENGPPTKLEVNIKSKNYTNETSKFFNEGGAALAEDPLLSKGNDLLSLSKETGKKKVSSVVRKNGVKFPQDQQVENVKDSNITTVTKHLNLTESTKQMQEAIIPSMNNKTNATLVNSKQTYKPLVHKPLVLSYETLSKMDLNQNRQSYPNILSSSKTIPDQVPSPNEGGNSKFYSMNAVKHPGMIMPIVITILVVPMFAVLGYLAVKRGKEAWKNRHYKRMDFLLDGMYND